MAEEKTSRQRRLKAVVFLAGIALIAVVVVAIVFSPPGKRRAAEKTETAAVENVEVKPDVNIQEKADDRRDRAKVKAPPKLKVEVKPPPPKPKPAPKKAARPVPPKPPRVGTMPGAEAGYGAAAPEESTQSDAQLPVGVGPVSDPSPTEVIDMLLERLELANIAFNAPRSMNISDSPKIQLLLSLGETEEELKAAIKAMGDKVGAAIRVNNRMQARLSGYMFQITAITPEEQAVSRSGRTEWSWEIHPKKEGSHDLHLTLSAIFEVNGRETRRVVRTFDRAIEVNVSASQKVTGFLSGNWQWLWAAVLVPIAGWLWKRKRG